MLIQLSVLFVSLFLVFIPSNTEGARPSGTIYLDDSEQLAHVGPGEDGLVTFTGTVVVDSVGPGQNVQMIIVNLQSDCTWPSTISPSTITFSPQEKGVPKPFEVVVRVPNFTPVSQPGEVIISGQMNVSPGTPVLTNIQPTNGIISIAPYVDLSLACENPYQNVAQGDMSSYYLKVKNEGNGLARVTAELQDIEDMIDDGWGFTDTDFSLVLDVHKEELLNITLMVPNSAPVKTYHFNVFVGLSSGDEMDCQTYKLFVNVTERKSGNNGEGGGGDGGGKDRLLPGFDISILITVLFVCILLAKKGLIRR